MTTANFDPGFTAEGTFAYDHLIAGDKPTRTQGVTLLTGQNLTRGAVLGRVTASGKYVLCDPAAADGSEVARGILVKDTDASGGDVTGTAMYTAGDFNENSLTIGGVGTADDIRDDLRDGGIYLHKAIAE